MTVRPHMSFDGINKTRAASKKGAWSLDHRDDGLAPGIGDRETFPRSRLMVGALHMLIYLKRHGEVFEPEEVTLLVGAFDKAWQTILASGVQLDGEAQAVREMLAKRIIEIAKRGERNQQLLCSDALGHLATYLGNEGVPARIRRRA
jgi:hypothetical protein